MLEQTQIERLLHRAKEGDRAAFESLMERYESRVRLFVGSRTRYRLGPKLDTEEILQETFVRVYQSLGRLEWRGEDAFFQWLCSIAKHAVLKATEKSRKDRAIDEADGLPAGDVSPSRLVRRNERFDRLQTSLDDLPEDYREVIRLARIDGLRIKEIAERMGRTPNAVKHLLARALTELKRHFGDTESLHLPDRRFTSEGAGGANGRRDRHGG